MVLMISPESHLLLLAILLPGLFGEQLLQKGVTATVVQVFDQRQQQ